MEIVILTWIVFLAVIWVVPCPDAVTAQCLDCQYCIHILL